MCKSIALIIVKFQRQVTDNEILSVLTYGCHYTWHYVLKIFISFKTVKACGYGHPFNLLKTKRNMLYTGCLKTFVTNCFWVFPIPN